MAERERLTNKERRAQARDERKRQEAEAARRKQRGSLRNGLVTLTVVGVIAAVLVQAFTGGPETIGETILVSSSAAEDAREAAGCEMLAERSPLTEAYHVDSVNQLDPALAYTDTRPTHSGPHTVNTHPVVPDASNQIDEVSSTHNLEHGTVIVWWDPEQIDSSAASGIGDWASTLVASGFSRAEAGVGIMTSPYEDPGISSGKAVAFRAWGTAMDCDTWDETVAHSFVIEHYGMRGIAPERFAAPYPDGVLDYEDQDLRDTTDAEAPGEDPALDDESDESDEPDAGTG